MASYTIPSEAGVEAKLAANAAADRSRANHTGTQSADTLTDGTTVKAYTATERTKLAGIASGATANRTDTATDAAISAAVNALISGAPGALDTLKELADAMADDAAFSATVTNALALKAPIASPTFTGTVSGVTAAMVGLGNVTNTSDANKPVSTAQAAALASKADLPKPARNVLTGWYHADGYGASTAATAAANTTAIQNAINDAATAGKGVVYIPDGTYSHNLLTLKAGVSIRGESQKGTILQLAASAGTSQIVSDGFAANTLGIGGSAWGAGAATVPSSFTIEQLTLDGNAAAQPAPGVRANWNAASAQIRLWGYHMALRDLELINAKELALYTEHYGAWETSFNTYQFGESTFERIYAKNFGSAGWVNRGPHDSRLNDVYLSAYQASGAYPSYGYIQQSSGSIYSSSGAVVNNLHVWGQFTQNSVLLDGSNVTDGFIYAEGSTYAAVYLKDSSANRFRLFYGYSTHGVELAGTSSDNRIDAVLESNGTGAVFKLSGANVGNRLAHEPGYSTPGTVAFDVSGAYTGSQNSFVPSPAYTGTQTAGTLGAGDALAPTAASVAAALAVKPTALLPSGDTTGTTDTNAINASLAVNADTFLAGGDWYVSAIGMTVNKRRLRGSSFGTTLNVVSGATGITLTGPGHCAVSDLTISGGDYGIVVNGAYDTDFSHLQITGQVRGGVKINGDLATEQHWTDVVLRGVNGVAFDLERTTTIYTGSLYMDRVRAVQPPAGAPAGFRFNSTAANPSLNTCFMDQCVADNYTGDAMQMINCAQVFVTNSWFAINGSAAAGSAALRIVGGFQQTWNGCYTYSGLGGSSSPSVVLSGNLRGVTIGGGHVFDGTPTTTALGMTAVTNLPGFKLGSFQNYCGGPLTDTPGSLSPVSSPTLAPADLSLKAWVADPGIITTANRTTPVAGQMVGTLLRLPADTVTAVTFFVGVAGVAVTNCFLALIDAATGNRLAVTADLSTVVNSTGLKRVAFTSPAAVADGLAYIVLLVGSATTMPQVVKMPNTDTSTLNVRGPLQTAGRIRSGQITAASGLTAIPATNDLTGSSVQNTGLWAAID